MGRRKKRDPVDRRKKVTISLLEREHAGQVTTPYRLMEELIETVGDHAHLRNAKIAIAWRFGKKADADGRLWLGTAKKGSDLDRAMHGYDFVVILNHDAWNQASFSEAQMVALLDHELSHCAVAHDTNGGVKLDEMGRTCYRIRHHDVEEFESVVKRRGLWKDDVRRLVEAADEQRKRPLLDIAERNGQRKTNGKAKTKGGKYPGRIRLSRDLIGLNTDIGGMFHNSEREVIGECNGELVVRADNGAQVHLHADSYEVVRWDKNKPAEIDGVGRDAEPALLPMEKSSGRKVKVK